MPKSRPLVRISVACLFLLALVTCREGPGSVETTSPAGQTYVTPTGLVTTIAPEVVVGAGDIAECGSNVNDEATAALMDGIAGTVITLGDNAYDDGSATDYANCYEPTWGRHKARTRPSAGNKEYETSGASGYFNYFGAAAGNAGEGYYSYDLGDWHIVVLNSNIPRKPGSPQILWLENDLANHPNQCTLAYFHHPLYSSTGGTGTGGLTYASSRTFWDVLYAAGVDVILGGHRHFYERMAPMKPDGSADDVHGIRQLIVGTGGRSGGSLTNLFPRHEVGEGKTYGVIKLTLYPDSYAWEFVPVAGKTFTDAGTSVCHGPPGSGGGGISPSLSTVAAEPAAITAGSGSSTITVTARDGEGDPVSGATVLLSATGNGNTLNQPSSPTDANGVASGTLSSTGAGTKTVSATISGTAITQTATVQVDAGAPSASQSTVGASPTTITVGTGSSTIGVTVKDEFGNPVAGSSVVLDATGTGNTLTQPSGPTDNNGLATGALASADEGTKTVSATADGTPITQTATVNVVPAGAANISHTLLTAGNNTINQKIYTTGSIAPAPNALVTVAVIGHRASGAPGSPTVSGGGMSSWSEVASVTFDPLSPPLKRVTVFRAMSGAPGSGQLTITFPSNVSNSQWIVSQWEGVETSGVNGAGAIVQTASTRADQVGGLTLALAPLSGAGNVAYGTVGLNAPGLVVSPGAGFTEIAEVSSEESPRSVLEASWAPDQSSMAPSWSGLLNAGLLGIELKAAAAP